MTAAAARWSGEVEDPYERRGTHIGSEEPFAAKPVGAPSHDRPAALALTCTLCRRNVPYMVPRLLADETDDGERGLFCSPSLLSQHIPSDLTRSHEEAEGPATLVDMLAAEERRRRRSRLLHHYLRQQDEAVLASQRTSRQEHDAVERMSSLPRILVSSVRTSAGAYGHLQPSPFSLWHACAEETEESFESLCLVSDDGDESTAESAHAEETCEFYGESCSANQHASAPAFENASHFRAQREVLNALPPFITQPVDWLATRQATLYMQGLFQRLFPASEATDNGTFRPRVPSEPLQGSANHDEPVDSPEMEEDSVHRFNPGLFLKTKGDSHSGKYLSTEEQTAASDTDTWPPQRFTTTDVIYEKLLRHVTHASLQASVNRLRSITTSDSAIPSAFHVNAPLCADCWRKRTLPSMQSRARQTLEDLEGFCAAEPSAVPLGDLANATSGGEPLDVLPTPDILSLLGRFDLMHTSPGTAVVTNLLPSVLSGEEYGSAKHASDNVVEAHGSMRVEEDEEIKRVKDAYTQVQHGITEAEEVLRALDAQRRENAERWSDLATRENVWRADIARWRQEEVDSRLTTSADMANSLHTLETTLPAAWAFPMATRDDLSTMAHDASTAFVGSVGFGTIAGLRLGLVVARSNTTRAHPSHAVTSLGDTPESETITTAAGEELLLWETVRRQQLYTQVLLSGESSFRRQLTAHTAAHDATAAVEERVSVQEVNTACGMLAQLLVELARWHKYEFRCARFHLKGDRTTIDILERRTPRQRGGGDSGGTTGGGSAAALFNATSFFGRAAQSGTSSRGNDDSNADEVTVKSTVDFFIQQKIFAWKTFGTACDRVLECVAELCACIQNGLQCQQRRLQFIAGPCPPPSLTTARTREVSACGGNPTEPPRGLESTFLTRPPFTISGNRIDGFPFTHGVVTDAVWTVAAKKVLANVQWCVEATQNLAGVQQRHPTL